MDRCLQMNDKKPIEVLTITMSRETAKDLYGILSYRLWYSDRHERILEIKVGTAEAGVKCRWEKIQYREEVDNTLLISKD